MRPVTGGACAPAPWHMCQGKLQEAAANRSAMRLQLTTFHQASM
jgi:hypothetical protein